MQYQNVLLTVNLKDLKYLVKYMDGGEVSNNHLLGWKTINTDNRLYLGYSTIIKKHK